MSQATTAVLPAVMTAEVAQALRLPFDPEHVGKLPRVTCPACRGNKFKKVCDEHKKKRCPGCRNWITTEHVHLDYVGHAEVTDRLLQVDPLWSWEPMAFDADGLPRLDPSGGLWIRLTVAGVTRIGYGDAGGKTGPDAVKETIGDSVRNAAMRFGVALDLWGAKFKAAEVEAEAAVRESMPDYVEEEPQYGPPVGAGRPPAEPARPVDRGPKPAAHNPAYYTSGVAAVAGATSLVQLEAIAAHLATFGDTGALSPAEVGRLRMKLGARRDELLAVVAPDPDLTDAPADPDATQTEPATN